MHSRRTGSRRPPVDRVADAVSAGRAAPGLNPLFLHGPSGTGKSHLASALIAVVTARAPDRIVLHRSAGDLVPPRSDDQPGDDDLAAARNADLVAIDDLHHLPERGIETFVQLLDRDWRGASNGSSPPRKGRLG